MASVTIFSSAGPQSSRNLTLAEINNIAQDLFTVPAAGITLPPLKVPTESGFIAVGRAWTNSSLIVFDMSNPQPTPAPAP